MKDEDKEGFWKDRRHCEFGKGFFTWVK